MSSAGLPAVDVYVIHWRAPDWCARATASLRASRGVAVRCTVIDNGTTGGSALAEQLDSDVELITTSQNLGYAGAANVALRHGLNRAPAADFIVIAAHDVHVEPDALAAMASVARHEPAIGILGPVLTAPAVEAGGWWRGWRAKATAEWDDSVPFEDRDWMSGTLLFIRPACVTTVGGFDESLGSYVEDVDLCLRARDFGWRVGVATHARAAGIGSASSNVTLLVDVNSVLVAAKRRGWISSIAIVLRYLWWSVRGLIAGTLPWRTAKRRRASREHARAHMKAVTQLARNWRHVIEMQRAPNANIPTMKASP